MASRGFASGGRGWRPAAPQAWEWLRGLWSGYERMKQRGAAKRPGRRAAKGDGKASLGEAARSYARSKVAALASRGGADGKEVAPSRSRQHQEPDPALVQVQASGF